MADTTHWACRPDHEENMYMGVSAKRIPPWLLPDSCLERANLDPANRSRLRPDILLVEMTQSESMIYRRPSHRHTKLSTIMNSLMAHQSLNAEKYG